MQPLIFFEQEDRKFFFFLKILKKLTLKQSKKKITGVISFYEVSKWETNKKID